MESEQIAKLQKELRDLEEKSKNDQRRLVKRLRELNDAERQKIIEDYESRLSHQTQEYESNIQAKQSELDKSADRLKIMSNMVDKLKQARIDLLEKIERKESEYLTKEESLTAEIQNLQSELVQLKKTSAEDNQSLQEISTGYMQEISQLQEQLAAAQATLKVIQQDAQHKDTTDIDSEAEESDANELKRLNADLTERLSKLESAYHASAQKCASLSTEMEQERSQVASLQMDLDSTLKNSESLQATVSTLNQEIASLRENGADIELYKDEINSLNEQVTQHQQRVSELEAQLANISEREHHNPTDSEADANGERPRTNHDDDQNGSSCDKCESLANQLRTIQLQQHSPKSFKDSSLLISYQLNEALNRLYEMQQTASEQRDEIAQFRNILQIHDDSVVHDEYQRRYDVQSQHESSCREICNQYQVIISKLLAAQSNPEHRTERLKQIIREQSEQHKHRISQADEKASSFESLLNAERKRVQRLATALKKMKESSNAAADSQQQSLKNDLESALARAESAETQVAHLQKSIEMIELAQKDSVKEQKSTTAKIEQLSSALQAEQERVKLLENEKQQVSALLARANKTVAELKDAKQSLSERISRLNAMIASHWLLDSSTTDENSAEFEVSQRCRVSDIWWIFIHVKVKSGDEITSRFFWTTIEAFDNYSGRKITTGVASDVELLHNRSAGVLSSGIALPESIESQSETNLKAKFDKKWNGAAKKFEKKIGELSQKLRSSQSEIERITNEFEEYRKQATIALEQNSGGAVRVSEMLDEIDLLKQERDSLQHSLQEATKRSVDNTNVEIQRLLNVIETNRQSFHQSELRWSQELQAAQVENERLVNQNQKEESAKIESLNEKLEILREELQRNRTSAKEIIKERDHTISGLHKQFVAAQENCQELQRQIRVLQAELVSLKQESPRQTHRSVTSEPLQQQRFDFSPQQRSSVDSNDQSVQIQKLQSLLRDAELQREHQAAQMRQLQSQIRELSKSNERSGANLDYLKHIVVKYMETDERLTLLPVIANILAFDPEETERIRAKLEKTNTAGLIPKIW